jgi:hypothetical protein
MERGVWEKEGDEEGGVAGPKRAHGTEGSHEHPCINFHEKGSSGKWEVRDAGEKDGG